MVFYKNCFLFFVIIATGALYIWVLDLHKNYNLFFVIIATEAGPKNLEKTGSCLKTPPSRRTPRRRCHRSLTAAMFLARSRP